MNLPRLDPSLRARLNAVYMIWAFIASPHFKPIRFLFLTLFLFLAFKGPSGRFRCWVLRILTLWMESICRHGIGMGWIYVLSIIRQRSSL